MKPTNRRFWIGVSAGLIATLVMSAAMMLGFAFAPHRLAAPLPFALLAQVVARALHRDTVDTAAVIVAIPLHFAYGALWAGAAALSAQMNWRRGVVIALGMWLIMAIFLIPLAGSETFAIVISPTPWIFTLVLHVIYGATFGAIVDRVTRSDTPHGDPETAAHRVR